MTKPKDSTPKASWFDQFVSGTSQDTQTPAFRAPTSPSERKADQSTRVAREATDAATEKRQALTAKLKAARLAKEAEDRAQIEQSPVKRKKAKTSEGTPPTEA
jgi:hypothetical protein